MGGDDDHDCAWKGHAEQLSSEVERLKEEMAALKRHIYGKKSEKMPPMDREVKRGRKPDRDATQRARRKNAELKAENIRTETVEVPVPESQRSCPKCGNADLEKIASTKPTSRPLS